MIGLSASSSLSELEEHALEEFAFVRDGLLLVKLLQRVDHRLDVLAVKLNRVEEVQDLIERAIGEDKHVLCKRLDQREQAALGVEPGIRAELLLEGLERLDDTRHAEVVVALGAVKRTDDQVDDTEVEDLLGRLLDGDSLFLLLDAFHQLLSIGILARHDVADAQVGEHDGSDAKQVIHLAAHKWLVVANSVPVLVVLHEENMSHVKLPSLMFTTEFSTLSKNFLNHGVVSLVPVYLGLHHEHWNILVESLIVLL